MKLADMIQNNGSSEKVDIKIEKRTVPTYLPEKPLKMPFFF
jgi:hypothetical protein